MNWAFHYALHTGVMKRTCRCGNVDACEGKYTHDRGHHRKETQGIARLFPNKKNRLKSEFGEALTRLYETDASHPGPPD